MLVASSPVKDGAGVSLLPELGRITGFREMDGRKERGVEQFINKISLPSLYLLKELCLTTLELDTYLNNKIADFQR